MSDFPGGGPDVPSNHLDKDNQVWERSWTLGEMRQASANWSLAADSGLFLFLQEFSQKMLSKTHDIEKQLDGLIRDTKATDSSLQSVFNDFLMLSNTQFIENRVYDEEVEEPSTKVESTVKRPEQEKTREQKEAELIPKMQEAVNYGLRVLDSAFEQLDIKAGNSDSEDEEATDRVEAILEPKDLYVDRPLPYLIGSRAFMEQEDVGLGDLSSDEMSIDSDRDSVIESDDGKEEVQSDEEFDEAEGQGSINKPLVLSYEEDDDEEEDDDSDIFGESDKEDYDDENERKTAGSSSFAEELAARIKGEPVGKVEEDRASLSSAKKKAKSKKVARADKSPAASLAAAAAIIKEDSDDMFQPPPLDDKAFSPFGGKGGLFSGGRGLFDDDGDEGDLFADVPKPVAPGEKARSNPREAESVKPEKKIPAGAVQIFPADSGLFGSRDSVPSAEGKENDVHGKPNAEPSPKQPPVPASGIGAGLFDDDEEDDFFSGRSLKTSSSAGQDTSKTRKVADLFLGEDEDEEEDEGDIFSEKSAVHPPAHSRKEVVEEKAKAPEKKMPAGAVSMFGPVTKSLLTEGLGRRRASTSEESERSENGLPVEAHTTANQPQKPKARGLFSDDEDTQAFPTISKSQSMSASPRPPKAPVSLFDDEEEEDLFASAAKSKPKVNQVNQATTRRPQKTVSLFSDDEDQWLSSKPGTGNSATKVGGMKASASAPSNLPGFKSPPKSSLFDDEDDELFASTKTSSPMKSQRVALLFEDDDDDKGFLFGSTPAIGSAAKAPAVKPPAVAPLAPALSLFDPEPHQVEGEEAPPASSRSTAEKTAPGGGPAPGVPDRQPRPHSSSTSSSSSSSISSSLPPSDGETGKRKPAAAAGGLSGGGDGVPAGVRGVGRRAQDSPDTGGAPAPAAGGEAEEETTKKRTNASAVSIFDEEEDDEDEDDDSDWKVSGSAGRTPVSRNTAQPTRDQQRTKSTGVFQEEELLFSDAQQKDNDPDVDLFAPSGRTPSAKPSSVKADMPSLFTDDDEDLFISVKPKPPHPKVAKKPSKPLQDPPSSSSSSSSSSVKSASAASTSEGEANLVINPTSLLPGSGPRIPGAVSVLPPTTTGSSSGVSSSCLSPSPATTPLGFNHTSGEEGVSFESPLQVAQLQSTNKSRARGSVRRRPQSRAARQQAAQGSTSDPTDGPGPDPAPSPPGFPTAEKLTRGAQGPALQPGAFPAPSPLLRSSPRPSVLSLPAPALKGGEDSALGVSGDVPPQLCSSDEDEDLFGSVSGGGGSRNIAPPAAHRVTTATVGQSAGGGGGGGERSAPVSIFDERATSDLFQKVNPRAVKAMAASRVEDDVDDNQDEVEEDIFGMSVGSTPSSTSDSKTTPSPAAHDIFQDDETPLPKAGHKKHKERILEASLFDDNVDIFADLTMSSGPKEKPKKKVDTKSIFDDDMDDIFSSNKVKPARKAPPKSKKTKAPQDNSVTTGSPSIFDDPLNALGGN